MKILHRFALATSALCAISLCALSHNQAIAESKANKQISTRGISSAIKRISSVLTKKGVTKLPSVGSTLSSSTKSSSFEDLINPNVVSGTPPTLPAIATSTIENVFWRSGVVEAIANGSPSQAQCSEFFSSDSDGFSGGLGACRMAESVGRSFQTMLDSETSLCYMKNLPTNANLTSGGVTLVSGKFPKNRISNLFLSGSSTRLVKINAPAFKGRGQSEAIFVRIASTSANSRANNLYRADLYFCPPGEEGPRGYNTIRVSNAGIMRVDLGNKNDPFGGGAHFITLRGAVKVSDGGVIWNTAKSRVVDVNVVRTNDLLKANFEIDANGLMTLKRRDTFQGRLDKGYTLAKFTGSDALTATFLEGAFSGTSERGDLSKTFSGATEYRDTFYAAAPSNSLLAQAVAYDMDSDSFYSAEPTVDVDTSKFSCGSKPNIEITMNSGNETLEASLAPCFSNRLQNMSFCRDSALVDQADGGFKDACVPPPPGDGGGPGGGAGGGGPGGGGPGGGN